MEIIIFSIISIIICVISFFIGKKVSSKPIEDKNEEIKKKNNELLKEQEKIKTELNKWKDKDKENEYNFNLSKNKRNHELEKLDGDILRKKMELKHAEDRTKAENGKAIQIQKEYNEKLKVIQDTEQLAKKAYEEQKENLEKDFVKDKEKIAQQKELLNKEIDDIQVELNSLKSTRAAAIEAARKEKQIHENMDEYCLILPREEERDIPLLREVQYKVSKPRAVAMAIWSAYYQPLAKNKFPKILGKQNVCGIYKITNQKTGECYIGQAVDIRKRWYDHVKAIIGIDTPVGNRLYAAAQEYGLNDFSFELLEECEGKDLDKKEKYFIELYQANVFGYNGNAGVKNGQNS